jgi:hypothetical protein
MLFRSDLYAAIGSGEVTVAFRRWVRPTVSAGGRLRTPVGVLHIDELTAIEPADITPADARAAGFDDPEAVVASLAPGSDRRLYRIRFHLRGDDPRRELRSRRRLDDAEYDAVDAQLDRWDRASAEGAWTRSLLDLIADRPGVRSLDLAAAVGVDQVRLKRRVRQLKELGLTESLDTGYRLAPRGLAYLERSSGRSSPASVSSTATDARSPVPRSSRARRTASSARDRSQG